MRRKARVDDNHAEIMGRFRSWPGVSVSDTSRLGEGFPDLVVGLAGVNLLVEVKDGSKPPSRRKLSPDENRWHVHWTGQVAIVATLDEVDALVVATRQRHAARYQDAIAPRRA